MKKSIYMTGLALIAAGGIFWSCQKDEFVTNSEEGMMLKAAYVDDACQTNCIDATTTDFWYQTGTISGRIGGGASTNNKHLAYSVHNTSTDVVVKLTYTRDNGSNNPTVSVTVSGITKSIELTYAKEGTLTFPMTITTTPCVQVSWSFVETTYDGQNALSNSGTYNLIPLCPTNCEESFGYVDNGDGSYTFTYIPAESMTGAQIVFTFAQGVAVSGLDEGWTTEGVTRQTTMDLTACDDETYVWTVTLTPNCSGNSKNSNVWTDFKVAPAGVNIDTEIDGVKIYSKKGTLSNIIIECP